MIFPVSYLGGPLHGKPLNAELAMHDVRYAVVPPLVITWLTSRDEPFTFKEPSPERVAYFRREVQHAHHRYVFFVLDGIEDAPSTMAATEEAIDEIDRIRRGLR